MAKHKEEERNERGPSATTQAPVAAESAQEAEVLASEAEDATVAEKAVIAEDEAVVDDGAFMEKAAIVAVESELGTKASRNFSVSE